MLTRYAGKAKAQKLGLALEELYADLGQPADRKLLCSLLSKRLLQGNEPTSADGLAARATAPQSPRTPHVADLPCSR